MTSPDGAAFDADDTGAIRDRLARHLARRYGDLEIVEGPDRYRGGLDTYVYAIRFAGLLPPEWAAPLVLRVYPTLAQAGKAEREAAIQAFVADRGFPAPRPLLVDTGDALGLPLMIMERAPGSQAIDAFKNPLKLRATIRKMASLQARLHALPIEGCPIAYDRPLVERMLDEPRSLVSRFRSPGLEEPLAWLESHAGLVCDEEPALLHNDCHPLNIMLDGERMTLLDWPDAAVGDRHCDVGRTLALFWLAAPLERSFAGRRVLGMLRRYIVPLYLLEYRKHMPLVDTRLRYWEALHAFKAWTQIAVLHREGEAALGARDGAATEVPVAMIPALEAYVRKRIALLG